MPATIGHDYGSTVEVMSSLTANDAVIIDPSDSILDGSPVQIAEPTPPPSATRRCMRRMSLNRKCC
ncbi:MAG: hypothetical protein WB586_28125 [Chthoniobacterales bacterium]